MATVETSPKITHSPPHNPAQRPRGILKNSYQRSPPPESPVKEKDLTEKELTIINTQSNAGHRRSSSATSRPAGSRRQSSRGPSSVAGDNAVAVEDMENSQRLKWDEANLYLTEQERTSTMKITEPKTPYAKHYDPAEDEDDDDDLLLDGDHAGSRDHDIPGLSLGEPEEDIPESEFASAKDGSSRKQSKVHVNDDDATPQHDADEYAGMTPEEREKHRRFEEARKKHYEMKDVAKFLGHPENLEEDLEEEDDDNGAVPPVPPMPANVPTINGAKVGAGD